MFYEMEMEINVCNNKNFTDHFLVEIKPHERIDLLITASMNIYQTKKKKRKKSIESNENMLF